MFKKILAVAVFAVGVYFIYQNAGFGSNSGEVIIFTVNDCPPCEDAKRFLDRNEPDYIEYNITESEENMNRYKKYGINRLPLIIVGDEIIKEYDETLLSIALNGLYEPDANSRTIVMYTKPGCGWCDKAREFLKDNDVEFTELDITASGQAQQEYDKLGGYGTPLILVGDIKIVGFNEKALKMALKQLDLI